MPTNEYRTPFGDRQLLELQLELECVWVKPGSTLVPFPCPNPDPPPRLLVVRHDHTEALYFRHDLLGHVREQLAGLSPGQAAEDEEAVKAILAQQAPCNEVGHFKAYVFPETMALRAYSSAIRLPEANEIGTPVFGIITDGRVVSACSSSRENDRSAEAWVWTEPEYRGRGYAAQATSAWARDLQQRGKVPFYSHRWDNLASQAVAQKLGLRSFLTAVGYS